MQQRAAATGLPGWGHEERLCPSLQTWLPRNPASVRGRGKPQYYCSQIVPMEAEDGTDIWLFTSMFQMGKQRHRPKRVTNIKPEAEPNLTLLFLS